MTDLIPTDTTPVRSPDGERWDNALGLVGQWLTEQSTATRLTYADAVGYPYHPVTGSWRDTSELRNGVAWLPWCAHQSLHLLDATRQDVLAWLEVAEHAPHPMTGKLLSKGSRAQMVSAVSSFYKWAVQEGHTEVQPVQINRQKKGLNTSKDASPTHSLDRTEVARLQEAADHDPVREVRARTSALIATLFSVGLRASELCNLDLADMAVMQGQRVLWLVLKGGKRHVVPLPGYAAERVDAYLAQRSDLTTLPAVRGQTGGDRRPLFATASGGRMQRSEVLRLTKRIAVLAGLDDPNSVHPHVARHSWITTARELGIEPSVIQEHVGHVDGKTTARYGKHALNVANSPASRVADAYYPPDRNNGSKP